MATEPIWQLFDNYETTSAAQQAAMDHLPQGTKRH